ncbi:hypothetical protein BROSI_A1321 [Candidatus Brocadia sinica JPN1]|uniref:Uncharacterized protein n=1 Tax=Candidatus Brocadia sinica JPN1 TaxID=1197129 RepID=A0ABQ0JVR4_9BACT|nr:hypothetical protein BROSI_A1321 [Candidatus Brocadia sinica JPN1]
MTKGEEPRITLHYKTETKKPIVTPAFRLGAKNEQNRALALIQGGKYGIR